MSFLCRIGWHDWVWLDVFSDPEGLYQAKQCKKCNKVTWGLV